jgi:hypothetical protein
MTDVVESTITAHNVTEQEMRTSRVYHAVSWEVYVMEEAGSVLPILALLLYIYLIAGRDEGSKLS